MELEVLTPWGVIACYRTSATVTSIYLLYCLTNEYVVQAARGRDRKSNMVRGKGGGGRSNDCELG